MDERSSDQIQRDIERTRGAMSETIDALERRLSPGEIIDELWGRMKGGQTGSNVGETIRDHPVPLALMGLGLGWLAIEKATESRTQQLRDRYGDPGEGTYARAEGRVGPYRGNDVIDPEFRYGSSDGIGSRIGNTAENVKDRATSVGSDLKDRVTEMSGDIKDRFSSATDAARDRMSDMGEGMHRSDGQGNMGDGGPGMGERAHHLRERASGELGHARETMRRRGNQLESTFRSLLDDYPLALGAVTFGLGLAAGASAPTTRREDELMGHAADTLRDEVKDVAKETTQRARTVAEEAARAAQDEVHNEGMGDDLKSKAERVVQAATSTARQEAESQGLTAHAMKERGREIGKHAAESAREGSSGTQTPSDTGGSGLHGSSFGTGDDRFTDRDDKQ